MLEVLWLFCLSTLGQPLKVQSQSLCNLEIVKQEQTVPKGVNFTLYTPSTNDMQSCFNASLLCFMEEMKVLNKELDLAGVSLTGFPRKMEVTLLRLANNRVKEASCGECELLPEMSANSFLQNLMDFLKYINSVYCK